MVVWWYHTGMLRNATTTFEISSSPLDSQSQPPAQRDVTAVEGGTRYLRHFGTSRLYLLSFLSLPTCSAVVIAVPALQHYEVE